MISLVVNCGTARSPPVHSVATDRPLLHTIQALDVHINTIPVDHRFCSPLWLAVPAPLTFDALWIQRSLSASPKD
jgi:hypothetical protein